MDLTMLDAPFGGFDIEVAAPPHPPFHHPHPHPHGPHQVSPVIEPVESKNPAIVCGLHGLADAVNAVAGDFHFIHFYAKSAGSSAWDRIHEIAGGYYAALGDDYDSIAELALQLHEDLTHPNDSATSVGFANSQNVDGFDYNSAMTIILDRLQYLLNTAAALLEDYQGGGPAETAVRNYLEDFIMRWSKEANYKTERRLS